MAIQYPELTIEDSILSEIHQLEEKVPNVPLSFWNRYFNLSLHNAVLHWQEEHEQCYNYFYGPGSPDKVLHFTIIGCISTYHCQVA